MNMIGVEIKELKSWWL